MTEISVIMPVFNEEKYVENAIKSVLNQSFEDFELIIVNDGSTDNTLTVVNSFKDRRIKLINQSNQGPGASRNNALKIASGKFIMFLDGDDWYCPEALKIAYEEITSKNTDISIFQIKKYDGLKYSNNSWFNLDNFSLDFKNRVFNPHECREFLFDISVSACQKIFKREFLLDINAKFPEGIYFEDMPFFFYTFLKAERVSLIKKHLYVRRKHEGSITEHVDGKFLDTVEAGRILMNIFIKNGWYDMYKFDLIAFKINGSRYALMSIEENYRQTLFELIKNDYLEIKSSDYYNDFLENLGPVKRKFFKDVIKSEDYQEFSKLN